MITTNLIEKVKKSAYIEYEKYGVPSLFQIEYTNEKGQFLAKKFKVNENIVFLGTILMDVKLGQAYKEERLKDHVNMSEEFARLVLEKDTDITKEEMSNILACIRQHHGVNKFESIESEIVCNSDCYKFLSIKGIVGGIKNMRDMQLDDLVTLFTNKADEKWNALSLDFCKEELRNEYKAIKDFLNNYKNE